jgi:hypothetical protein
MREARMAHLGCFYLPPSIPPELVRAVASDAALDADRVGRFLEVFSQTPVGRRLGPPQSWATAAFLVRLAAVLRLLDWEASGIDRHLEAGLPAAQQALRELAEWQMQPSRAPADQQEAPLLTRVLALFVEHFCWDGRAELGADLTLGVADEDQLVDALADLLWAHRHALPPEPNTERGRAP